MVDLPGAGEAGEKDCQALFMPWWKTASQFPDDLGIGKPRRNVAPFIQSLTQFCAREMQNVFALRELRPPENIYLHLQHRPSC